MARILDLTAIFVNNPKVYRVNAGIALQAGFRRIASHEFRHAGKLLSRISACRNGRDKSLTFIPREASGSSITNVGYQLSAHVQASLSNSHFRGHANF